MKIVLTGGGSGGHVFPLIAVVREIKSLYLQKRLAESRDVFGEFKDKKSPKSEGLDFYYLGPRDEFSLILLSQEGVRTEEISAGKLRRYLTAKTFFENLVDIFFRVPWGILQSFFRLFFFAPDLIFSKGGYGSFPVVLAAFFLRIPIFLHESDVDPGLSNQILCRFSQKIFVSFPKTERFPLSKMILVGNPIRKEILAGSPSEAKELFKLAGGKPVLLVLGGSQGAQRVNDLILAILPSLLPDFEILHQIGEKNFLQVKAEADVTVSGEMERFYHPFAFFREEEVKQAYAAADLVVGRAGAGVIFEIAAVGKPSILIPYPEAAQGHQLKNAYAFSASGASVVFEEGNLTPNFFLEKLDYLFSRPQDLEKMRQAAVKFAKPQAALEIAQYLFAFLKM
ncbi:MAG: UDP-N-acetylglucosamine--N-acetylmuramyl-(pentapeptide) pyrophosphoryl-undecaprenol N-acetylglucosamine transferase [Candidatus Nealsonbacteria bacterium]|nr:UDP-N-acetylglucosamine--N-acetylmuramyl-(pentapeptide) pyrophosphoryl-undecaprenol N-acetylglucosamine transferase [Candidatus Nealsonbacteria bacterium]